MKPATSTVSLDLNGKIKREVTNGNYWGVGGAIDLVLQKIEGLDEHDRVKYLPDVSAVYYSAAMRALADRQIVSWWRIGVIASLHKKYWQCIRLARRYSNQWADAVPSQYTTPERLQVRAMILIHAGKLENAKLLIEEAFKRESLNVNTKTLLHILLAKIHWKEADYSGAKYQYELARNSTLGLDPSTRTRLMRAIAEESLENRDFRTAFTQTNIAMSIAENNGLGDQVAKIQAFLKRVKNHQGRI